MTVTLTIYDDSTGQSETVIVPDHEYYLLCTGNCYVAHTQMFPKSGTHILTIKGRRDKYTVKYAST